MRPHQSWNYSSRSKWCVCLGCPQRLMLAAMTCCTGMYTIDLFLSLLLLLQLLLLLSLLLLLLLPLLLLSLLLLPYDCFLVCKYPSLKSFYSTPNERIELSVHACGLKYASHHFLHLLFHTSTPYYCTGVCALWCAGRTSPPPLKNRVVLQCS